MKLNRSALKQRSVALAIGVALAVGLVTAAPPPLVTTFGVWGPAQAAPGVTATYTIAATTGANAVIRPFDAASLTFRVSGGAVVVGGDVDTLGLACSFTPQALSCVWRPLTRDTTPVVHILVQEPESGAVTASVQLADSQGQAGLHSITTAIVAPPPPSPYGLQPDGSYLYAPGIGLTTASYRDNRLPACPLDVRYWGGICPVPLGDDAG